MNRPDPKKRCPSCGKAGLSKPMLWRYEHAPGFGGIIRRCRYCRKTVKIDEGLL